MRIKLVAIPLLFALGMAHAAGRPEAILPVTLPAGPYALANLVLIDGTGAAPRTGCVVVISKGLIEAVGVEKDVILPPGCERVDLKGAYLLPGFINAHVHRAYNADTLRGWLSAGVTSVRDLGPMGVGDFLAERDRLNRDPLNARIISATPLLTRPGGYGSAYVDGPDSARAAVRGFAERGVDLVKVAIEDDLQGRTWPMLSAAEVAAIVSESHARGLRVSAHISHVRNLPLALDAGVDDLAHMVVEPLPQEMIRALVARGIAWVPTLELWKGVSEKHSLGWIRIAVANTAAFFRSGGTIALGTDFSGYTTPFDTGFPITEVRLLKEAGLSPLEIITAGTRNAALVSGWLDRLGTIEQGKIADLVVVGGNPLADIGALQKPLLVIKGGAATGAEQGGDSMALTIASPAFKPGGTIPRLFTADGRDVSPALSWENPPAGTQAYALICDDPDAPGGTWTHWVAWNLPPAARELVEGVKPSKILADGSAQGKNDFGRIGYGGPSPPPGKPHRYFFRLFALKEKLVLAPGSSKRDLEKAMAGRILGTAEVFATYGR